LLTTRLSARSGRSVQCPTMIGPNGRPGNARRGKDAEARTCLPKMVMALRFAVR
jgi:hypothetical protein